MIYFARWKVTLILLVCTVGLVFAAPNLFDRQTVESLPGWIPNQQISLGLDLQGGSHLLLEADTAVVLRERMSALVDELRSGLRKGRIGYRALGVISAGDGVTFTLRNPEDLGKARSLIRDAEPDIEIVVRGNRLTARLTELARRARVQDAMERSIEIVRRRVDETGTREPAIQRQGENRILVQLPGVKDPERIKRLLGKTAKLNFHLLDLTRSAAEVQATGRVPPGSMLLPSDADLDSTGQPVMYLVRKRVIVGGDTLVDAEPTFQDNQPVVSFRFDSVGGRKFANVTRRNVGKPFAIVLDNKVISAPVIREPILGGSGIISGNFTVESARDLALLLRAGALPAPLTVLEERTVGPGLGADSIRAGKIASVLAVILVVVFMAMAYGMFGLMANLALFINLILIAAALSLLQATLTLPGIAGIVLTIGMAVDANVLVFERIREEARAGRPPISAIDAGYQRALKTIIDANLTTLFAAIILYFFGSGPIKGFAVTLAIGIMSSMFTAIMVTRLMVVVWLRRRRPSRLPI
jgi:preprotein translocase subunit SecD